MFRALKLVSAGAVALGGVGAAVASTDEGTRRSVAFWRVAGPAYAHYRFTQWRLKGVPDDVADREWERLHEIYAPRVRDAVLQLKGFFLKSAQIMSTQDGFMPAQYLEVCKMMQDRVPTEFEPGQARRMVEAELRCKLEDVFLEFDDAPIGAASIGQVHRARLRDGRVVAVKVQYPGIEHKFRADIKTTIFFCDLAMPHQAPAVREIEKMFDQEFDYVREQQNMRAIHDSVARRFGERVVIPEPIPELCTRTVLTMTYVPGVKLVDALNERFKIYAKAANQSVEDFLDEQRRLMKTERSLTQAKRQAWIDARLLFAVDLLRNAWRAVRNAGAFVLGRERLPYTWTPPPINLGAVLELLGEVTAYQILEVGVFNADPHPGNIMLIEPGDRLGLVDYGQCKRFSDAERRELAELIVALADDDRERIIAASVAMGARTKKMDPDVLYRLACFWYDRDDAQLMLGLNLSDFLDEMERRDGVVAVTDRHMLAGRASILLRGMGHAFKIDMRMAPLWRTAAEKVLQEAHA
jgi:aarF domain-containing kinase